MRWILGISGVVLVAIVACTYVQNQSRHHGMHQGQVDLDADPIARGGRGYDKWWVEYELQEPTLAHTSYPDTGKAKPADTWRCKECHGWDYRGKDGAYSTGSHFSGIEGIRAAAGKPVAEIVEVLSDESHRFQAVLPLSALEQIAQFTSAGQVNMRPVIDDQSRAVSGDANAGQALFDENCSDCHGSNGRDINFASDEKPPEYVGTVARKNPWEAWHKLRNGHPGAFVRGHMGGRGRKMGMGMGERFMPPMRSKLALEQQSDLLGYLQTLPAK